MARSSLTLAASCLLLAVAGINAQTTILQAIQSANLTLLAAGIQVSGLAATLNSTTGPNITLFAPSDQALLDMTASLGTDPTTLVGLGAAVQPIFLYHGVPTPLLAANIPTGDTPVPTLNAGLNLTVSKAANGSVVVRSVGSDANVIRTDILAGGSVVHVIDKVLIPFYTTIASAAARNPQLSSLLSAASSAGLASTLSNPNLTVTVFAPVNAAFTAAAPSIAAVNASLADVLTYHVLPARVPAAAVPNVSTVVSTLNSKANLTVLRNGSAVTVTPVGATPATVIAADIPIGLNLPTSAEPRSYVHLVNAVLLPFYTTVANAAQRAGLTTLLAAVTSDGSLLSAVTDPNFKGTVLAPTNEAFARALSDLKINASQLLADTANLRKILNAHVITSGAVRSSQLTDKQVITTAGGANLTVSKNGTSVSFIAGKSSAKVATADIQAGGAIVHTIDYVLIPADVTLTTGGDGGGGAAGMASPSVVTLLSSALAFVALFAFGRF
ncbi:hypothetical protein HYH02_002929 [Chlamydomonas schloesseri]|uniref:FAS1 domain-containing protein n=1 Tax=Chlamydomonas schloesseri TaxID=2026947 RepID=A0A835WRR2_9CHLO|nr:hypothetical protein HYH02_002929 [Chlamydomonas schloesseri]|eukprot:KAG2452697.1 hypothetical protein HYH02_002929 [Chlamydomonas schloesseri]